jgi:hypothetical protein
MADEIQAYLKYANVQIAAEALLDLFPVSTVPGLKDALAFGNNHSSKFTAAQADQFIDDGWTVVDHEPNTSPGFSGTLFKNTQTGEYVMSFRSTEFIDDAARDNQATNALEIKEKGWAFGQIDEMENWFSGLQSSGKLEAGYRNGDIPAVRLSLTRCHRRRSCAMRFLSRIHAARNVTR